MGAIGKTMELERLAGRPAGDPKKLHKAFWSTFDDWLGEAARRSFSRVRDFIVDERQKYPLMFETREGQLSYGFSLYGAISEAAFHFVEHWLGGDTVYDLLEDFGYRIAEPLPSPAELAARRLDEGATIFAGIGPLTGRFLAVWKNPQNELAIEANEGPSRSLADLSDSLRAEIDSGAATCRCSLCEQARRAPASEPHRPVDESVACAPIRGFAGDAPSLRVVGRRLFALGSDGFLREKSRLLASKDGVTWSRILDRGGERALVIDVGASGDRIAVLTGGSSEGWDGRGLQVAADGERFVDRSKALNELELAPLVCVEGKSLFVVAKKRRGAVLLRSDGDGPFVEVSASIALPAGAHAAELWFHGDLGFLRFEVERRAACALRSLDGGESWMPFGAGLPPYAIYSCAVAKGAIFVVAAANKKGESRLYRSDDRGEHFKAVPQADGELWKSARFGASLQVHPLDDSALFMTIAARMGVWRSLDEGRSWVHLGMLTDPVPDARSASRWLVFAYGPQPHVDPILCELRPV